MINDTLFHQLFHFDLLTLSMLGLILFLGMNIAVFSTRYMQGDSLFGRYFLRLACLIIFLLVMVSADHLVLFLIALMGANMSLCRLMVHKSNWKAAKYSGLLALKNFFMGFAFIGISFLLLYVSTGQHSIRIITETAEQTPLIRVSLLFLILGAMAQSAIWPFHRWVLSSLNSPTPVSAMMHAGVINGGGFILLRFGKLFANDPFILQIIFVIGVVSCLVGTLWKLLQHDIKRSLAASTIGQMGFMFAQFGLGLYAATLAHIFLHGLYKSFSFLNIGNAAGEKRYEKEEVVSLRNTLGSMLCSATTLISFSLAQGQLIVAENTFMIPQVIVAVVGFQIAQSFLTSQFKVKDLIFTLLLGSFVGYYYGFVLLIIEHFLYENIGSEAQPLSFIYVTGILSLVLSWAWLKYAKLFTNKGKGQLHKVYVKLLNASQPHADSITSIRNQYKYQ